MEPRRLVLEEALDGPQVLLDGGAAGERRGVVEQTQREPLDGGPRPAAQQGVPQRRPLRGQTPERVEAGVAGQSRAGAARDRRRVPDEAQEPHQREEPVGGDVAGAKGPVQLERRERLRRRGETEMGRGAVRVDPDERVEEGKRARDVGGRSEGLDEADFLQRRVELGVAHLPGDPRRPPHQVAALAVLLPAPRRPVLREPPAEIARLADVQQRAVGVVEPVDAGRRRDAREEVAAELPVEGAHAPIVAAARPNPCRHSRGPR